MTKEEVIEELCAIVWMAYKLRADYSKPCDCFCKKLPEAFHYQNSGDMIRYVKMAVKNQLLRDGK